jgi:tyrosinase
VSPSITNTGLTFNYQYPVVNMPRAERDAEILEWSARVQCTQFELHGSFSVYIFLGEIPADPDHWLTDIAFAGTFDVFANPKPEECANCREQTNLVIKGFVHLNRSILKRSGKDSLEPDVVVPYLKHDLNWAIRKVSGNKS